MLCPIMECCYVMIGLFYAEWILIFASCTSALILSAMWLMGIHEVTSNNWTVGDMLCISESGLHAT